jgi:hypothetical protein
MERLTLSLSYPFFQGATAANDSVNMVFCRREIIVLVYAYNSVWTNLTLFNEAISAA